MPNQTSNNHTTTSADHLLQETFSPTEMQVIMASLFEGVSDATHIPGMVAFAVEADSAVRHVISRIGTDVQGLLGKLDALPQAALRAIQHGVSQYRTMTLDEMFGPDRMPSLATLARLGLIRVRGQAAWGLAVVQLRDWRTCEFVLRQDPTTMGVGKLPYSLDHASAGIVKLVGSALDGEVVAKWQHMALGLAGLIALHTGWRFFRVEERNGCAVVEIPWEDMLGDLYRGELGGLVLQGVNAPEIRLT